jgi:peptidoglycan/LPS O-acetylase OafA/YrhL
VPYLAVCEVSQHRFYPDLVAHVFLVHGLIPAVIWPMVPSTLLGVAWTLSLEEQFYAVAPFVIRLSLTSRSVCALLFTFTAAATLAYRPIVLLFFNAFLLAKAGFFLVGALSYFALSGPRTWPSVLRFVIIPSAVLSLLLLLGTPALLETWLPSLVWAVLVSAIVIRRTGGIGKLLDSKTAQSLGRSSYSTYLFHGIVITLVQWALWKWIQPRGIGQLVGWTLALAVPITMLVAQTSWRLIEQPFQRLGRG